MLAILIQSAPGFSRRRAGWAAVRMLLLLLLLLLPGTGIPSGKAGAAPRESGPPPRVLLLFSNDRLLPANQRLDEGLRRALNAPGSQPEVMLFAEFLDAIRFAGPEREAAMEEYLKKRYDGTPPDVIVGVGPQALDFFMARRDSLFPGQPLVFGGVGPEKLEPVRGRAGVTGLPMELNVAATVEAVLAMRPRTREILLVHGTSEFDRNWRDTALRQCAVFTGRVDIVDCPELPLEDLRARLRALTEETVVLYLSWFQSPSGESHTPARVAADISAVSAVPVVGPYDTYIGTGILGGSVSPFVEDGLTLGRLIRRVIAGEKPEDIGILPPNVQRLILDARQMKRWGIPSAPAGAEVRHRRPTLWEEHRAGTAAGITLVAVQSILIAWLGLARRRQRRAEKKLRLSEERFSRIFEGTPAAMSIVRQSDGRIIDVNPGWEAITGRSRAEAIGRTPVETGMVIDGDAESRFRLFLKSGKPLQDYEQILHTQDGRIRWLSLSTELLTLRDEPCFVVVAKDVTEPREAEEARQQLARTSRLAMLGEMTASIAHEVNQPLGAILSNADAAEMLLDLPAPPMDEVRQILADIRRDDLRASAVIKRVRAIVGRREVMQAPLDLNEALLETIRLVRHDAHRRGMTLTYELADGLPLVSADAVQMEQVLLNLLFNAMDAMKDTAVAARRVTVRSSRHSAETVAASVKDNGHGIPREKLPRVFDSFFTTKEGGMGLGLALARSIAEAHGGWLSAENNPGGGATFHFILPLTSHDGLSL